MAKKGTELDLNAVLELSVGTSLWVEHYKNNTRGLTECKDFKETSVTDLVLEKEFIALGVTELTFTLVSMDGKQTFLVRKPSHIRKDPDSPVTLTPVAEKGHLKLYHVVHSGVDFQSISTAKRMLYRKKTATILQDLLTTIPTLNRVLVDKEHELHKSLSSTLISRTPNERDWQDCHYQAAAFLEYTDEHLNLARLHAEIDNHRFLADRCFTFAHGGLYIDWEHIFKELSRHNTDTAIKNITRRKDKISQETFLDPHFTPDTLNIENVGLNLENADLNLHDFEFSDNTPSFRPPSSAPSKPSRKTTSFSPTSKTPIEKKKTEEVPDAEK